MKNVQVSLELMLIMLPLCKYNSNLYIEGVKLLKALVGIKIKEVQVFHKNNYVQRNIEFFFQKTLFSSTTKAYGQKGKLYNLVMVLKNLSGMTKYQAKLLFIHTMSVRF